MNMSKFYVNFRSVCATIEAAESNVYYIFWLCVCSFRYTACNAHAPIVVCCLSGCTIFPNIISHTARVSGKQTFWT